MSFYLFHVFCEFLTKFDNKFLYIISFFAYTCKKGIFLERGELMSLFIKLFKLQPALDDKPYMILKDDIERTAADLNDAYTNLQNVTDPDLIDYYIYQTKAVQMRYRYLLSCAKKLEDSYAKNPLL